MEVAAMPSFSAQPSAHGVFAQELQRILVQHGATLWSLSSKAHIHPERVRKLHQSLTEAHISTLNPTEMHQVEQAFALSPEEVLDLKASLLVTAIASMLLDRINLNLATRITTKLLPLMKDLLLEDAKHDRILLDVEGYDTMQDNASLETLLLPIANTIDTAILAQHLSEVGTHLEERIKNAQAAYHSFVAGLAALSQLPPDVRQTDAWQFWQQEAQQGLDTMTELLARAKTLMPDLFSF
jgi:hypothetical protein